MAGARSAAGRTAGEGARPPAIRIARRELREQQDGPPAAPRQGPPNDKWRLPSGKSGSGRGVSGGLLDYGVPKRDLVSDAGVKGAG